MHVVGFKYSIMIGLKSHVFWAKYMAISCLGQIVKQLGVHGNIYQKYIL